MYAGSHISSSGGYKAMAQQAVKLGANTFAFFTRNPRGGKAKDIEQSDIDEFLIAAKENNFGKIVAHASYTMNLCSSQQNLREWGTEILRDDLQRMEYTPNNYYNFHPGSHTGQGADVGIKQISDALNAVLTPSLETTVLLETMAGKGSEVGCRFEEIKAIIDSTEHSEKLGVCLDTCHVWDAGYDIVNNLDAVLESFDNIIGLDRLCAIHCNDSMNDCGAHKDRHAKLGEGFIGLDAFKRIVTHPALKDKPFVLETPNDDAGWTKEIALLRSF